jgi:transposase-like protein
MKLSDPLEEVYDKYIRPSEVQEPESVIACPKCDSTDVDRKAGYRGEYKCRNCGHFWRRT